MQIPFMRGAWTAGRKILVPVAWNTASNETVSSVRGTDKELDALEPLAEAEGRVAGPLHGPLARRAGGDPPMYIRRVPYSMNTRMRFSSTVSTCRKSTARWDGYMGFYG